MIGFLRTVIFMVGAYYIIKFLMRLFAPAPPKTKSQNTYTQTHRPKKTTYKDNAGEYVDYEELKD